MGEVPGQTGFERVVDERRVAGCIVDLLLVFERAQEKDRWSLVDLQQRVVPDRVVAERDLARRLAHAGEADIGLEPLPLLVDQAQQRDRGAACVRSRRGQRVEQGLGRAVEHHQLAQPGKPARLFWRGGQQRHSGLEEKARIIATLAPGCERSRAVCVN